MSSEIHVIQRAIERLLELAEAEEARRLKAEEDRAAEEAAADAREKELMERFAARPVKESSWTFWQWKALNG